MRPMTPSPWTRSFASLLGGALLLAGLCAPAQAQRAVPESAVGMKQSFAPVVKRAAPAVVNVYVRHRVEQMVSPFVDDPFFGRLFGDRRCADGGELVEQHLHLGIDAHGMTIS